MTRQRSSLKRPACWIVPFSSIATSANERCTSRPMTLIFFSLILKHAGADGPHDNYGFALAAHPGKSRGRPDNNTSSQLIVGKGLTVASGKDTQIPDR